MDLMFLRFTDSPMALSFLSVQDMSSEYTGAIGAAA